MRRGTTAAAVAAVVLTNVLGTTGATAAGTATDPTVEAALAANTDVHDAGQALDWDPADETAIALTGATAQVTGPGATVTGGTVTITSPGTYRVRGTLSDGALVVTSPGDGVVRIVLDGASVTSTTTSPLQVLDADEAVVVLLSLIHI